DWSSDVCSSDLLQIMAFLNKGLEIRLRDERKGHELEQTYKYTGGIVDFVRHLNTSKEALFKRVGDFESKEADQEVEVALQWNTGYYESIHSFANGIATIEGGMHEEGFKKALTNVVNRYAPARSSTSRSRRRGRASPPGRRATSSAASRRSRAPACRGSWPTARHATRANRSCSSSRATRPARRPRTRATRAPRRSCPSAGRS